MIRSTLPFLLVLSAFGCASNDGSDEAALDSDLTNSALKTYVSEVPFEGKVYSLELSVSVPRTVRSTQSIQSIPSGGADLGCRVDTEGESGVATLTLLDPQSHVLVSKKTKIHYGSRTFLPASACSTATPPENMRPHETQTWSFTVNGVEATIGDRAFVHPTAWGQLLSTIRVTGKVSFTPTSQGQFSLERGRTTAGQDWSVGTATYEGTSKASLPESIEYFSDGLNGESTRFVFRAK